jgi:ABC-type amino acid transport substrate-binding protein
MRAHRLLKALKVGRIDLISGIMLKPESKTGINLIETGIQVEKKYFVNNACITVTCYKDLPGHTIAIEKGRDFEGLVPISEDIHFLKTTSQQQALSLVNSGRADVYISNSSLTSLYFIQAPCCTPHPEFRSLPLGIQ